MDLPTVLVRGTITFYHRLGGLNNSKWLFTVLMARSSSSRCWLIWYLPGLSFWPGFLCSRMGGREIVSLVESLLIRAVFLCWGSALATYSSPKAHFQIPSHWGLGFNTWILRGLDIWSLAQNLFLLFMCYRSLLSLWFAPCLNAT